MLRIRLSRVGKKGQPYYRIVVADAEAKRDGRIVENIGHYDTLTKPSTFNVKEDRVLYWLSVGAQPSDTVLNFLKKRGTMKRLARLRAGESLETLAAEVESLKEAARPAPKKAAPAPAPVAEPEAVVEMEAVEQPEAAAPDEVVEMEAVEQPVAAEPEAVVEMETVDASDEVGEGFFGRLRDAVEEAAETVGDAAAGAAGAVREAVAEIFTDEEE
jgi:small subunit ribosomal protein S16